MTKHYSSNAERRIQRGWKTSLLLTILTMMNQSDAFLPTPSSTTLYLQSLALQSLRTLQDKTHFLQMSLDSETHRTLQTKRNNSHTAYRRKGMTAPAAGHSRPKARQSFQSNTKRLTRDEQMRLLKQYSEYQRIQSILNDLPDDAHNPLTMAQKAKYCNMALSTYSSLVLQGPKARDTLLLHNLPLIQSIVMKCTRNMDLQSLTHQDLVQEGILGLAKAIQKFDVELAEREELALSTYATYWIRASIMRAIAKSDELIRVPEHVNTVLGKLSKSESVEWRNSLGGGDGRNGLNVQDLAKEVDVSESLMRNALQVKARRQASYRSGNYLALEDWMMTRQGQNLLDASSSNDLMGGSWAVEREGQLDNVKETLGRFLSGKEMEALSWRYGLSSVPESTKDNMARVTDGPSRVARDYEAEAEEDIFGTGGILNSAPSNPKVTVTTTRTSQQRANTSPPSTWSSSGTPSMLNKGGRWGEAMSFKEVGEQMRVSAEYGRRLCSSALKKLKEAAEEGNLDPGMLF